MAWHHPPHYTPALQCHVEVVGQSFCPLQLCDASPNLFIVLALKHLAGSSKAGQQGSSGGGGDAMQRAYLRILTAKWLSCTRSDSPSAVLSLMQVGCHCMGRE